MIIKGWRRRLLALASAVAAVAAVTLAAPSAASADALRPLTLTLTCTQGMPYGYQVNTGSGWYYPPASSDATVVGDAKTFHLLLPTGAGSLAVNTFCDGVQNTLWEGYTYGISPGTSTVNASGNCNTYPYSVGYGVTYLLTYCTLRSITYS